MLKRRAAVKVLHRTARMNTNGAMRFISEAQAANQIRSRYIVDIFSFGKLADGRHFYVMELLDGEPLTAFSRVQRRLASGGPPAAGARSPRRSRRRTPRASSTAISSPRTSSSRERGDGRARQGARLRHRQARGRPAGGQPRRRRGAIIGTPLYMSPEQARGKARSTGAPSLCTGALVSRALDRQDTFKGETAVEVLAGHFAATPPRVSAIGRWSLARARWANLRMLEKSPSRDQRPQGRRYRSCAAPPRDGGGIVPASMPHLPPPRGSFSELGATPGLPISAHEPNSKKSEAPSEDSNAGRGRARSILAGVKRCFRYWARWCCS